MQAFSTAVTSFTTYLRTVGHLLHFVFYRLFRKAYDAHKPIQTDVNFVIYLVLVTEKYFSYY